MPYILKCFYVEYIIIYTLYPLIELNPLSLCNDFVSNYGLSLKSLFCLSIATQIFFFKFWKYFLFSTSSFSILEYFQSQIVLISGIQQSDSVIYIHISIIFQVFSHTCYYRILSRVHFVIQEALIRYIFKIVCMSVSSYQFIIPSAFPIL